MKNNSLLYIDSDGTKIWFLNNEYSIVKNIFGYPKSCLWKLGAFKYLCGKPHRVGAPAIIFNNGEEQWWSYGVRHRENGPQASWNDDDGWVRQYAKNGKLLRLEFESGEVWNYE